MPFGPGDTMAVGIEFEIWYRLSITPAKEVSSWAVRRVSLTSAWIISGSNLSSSYRSHKRKLVPIVAWTSVENRSTVTNPTVTGIVLAGLIDDVVKLCAATFLTSPTKHNITVKTVFIVLRTGSSKRPWRKLFKIQGNKNEKRQWKSRPSQRTRKQKAYSQLESKSYAIVLKDNRFGVGTNESCSNIDRLLLHIHPEQLTFRLCITPYTSTRFIAFPPPRLADIVLCIGRCQSSRMCTWNHSS